MRTTLIIDDSLVEEASRLTGEKQKTALVRRGLEALIRQEAAHRLSKLGGSDPRARAGRRRRSE